MHTLLHTKVKQAITNSGRTEVEFFQMCHLWRFQKVQNCVDDVCQYRLHGIIPKYVQQWVTDQLANGG
jgi:hypothetical protein